MKKLLFRILFIAFAVQFPLVGQSEKDNLPPVVIRSDFIDNEFIIGQNLVLKYLVLFRNDIDVIWDDLKTIEKPFIFENFSVSTKKPVRQLKDYSYVEAVLLLDIDKSTPYGDIVFPARSIRYQFRQYETVNLGDTATSIKVSVIQKTATTKKLTVKRVPFIVRSRVSHEAVHIGDKLFYILDIWQEPSVVVLNESKATAQEKVIQDLDYDSKSKSDNEPGKAQIFLEKPNFSPFELLQVEVDQATDEKTKIICKTFTYTLSLYDIDYQKPFEIPSLRVVATYWDGERVLHKSVETPKYSVRTNSVLGKNTDFRPLKGFIREVPPNRFWFGKFPKLVGFSLIGIAVMLYATYLVSLIRIKKDRSLGKKTKSIEKTISYRQSRSMLESWLRAEKASARDGYVATRLFLGAILDLSENAALSLTAREFEEIISKRGFVRIAGVGKILEKLETGILTTEDRVDLKDAKAMVQILLSQVRLRDYYFRKRSMRKGA